MPCRSRHTESGVDPYWCFACERAAAHFLRLTTPCRAPIERTLTQNPMQGLFCFATQNVRSQKSLLRRGAQSTAQPPNNNLKPNNVGNTGLLCLLTSGHKIWLVSSLPRLPTPWTRRRFLRIACLRQASRAGSKQEVRKILTVSYTYTPNQASISAVAPETCQPRNARRGPPNMSPPTDVSH